MKNSLTLFFIFFFSLLFCCSPEENISGEEFNLSMVNIYDTTFASQIIRDSIRIDVSLPVGYDDSPQKTYPVIYMTDGYWRREEHVTIHEMGVNREIDKAIVVGIGYPDGYDFNRIRVRDLVNNPHLLLMCIRYEIMNYVENKYRINKSNRTLWGSSYGGHFLVYAFSQHINSGSLFINYIGASPALNPTNQSPDLLAEEEKLFQQTENLSVNLYLTVGGNETEYFLNSYNRIINKIHEHNYSGLRFEHEIIPDKDHYTVWKPTLLNGLRKFMQ